MSNNEVTNSLVPINEYITYSLTHVMEHNQINHSLWIIIDYYIYDITKFIDIHPGKEELIAFLFI